jgi:thymidylate kinase
MKIIYLSGIDGCGKTTQAKLLVESLRKKGINAKYMWFRWEPSLKKFINLFRKISASAPTSDNENQIAPGDRDFVEWSNAKKNILDQPFFRKLWIFYASADYFFAYNHNFKKVKADIIVIDRYIDDFFIDQAVNLGIPPEQIGAVQNNYFLKKFDSPDYKIIIDLPAAEGYLRKRDGTSISYLKSREDYYNMMEGPHMIHINGLEDIAAINAKVVTWVYQQIGVDGT